eukprot:TRINITY_DN25434_c0_g2_i1.p1 TRINITY_DN25434_c0_g2~~TRINITY_DN25434_c0_g2_i1.p1  ORF type:complete len:480 (+),score=122.65 TRINITY_DN25434_c0_g2_i1:93-1442(+)
MLRPGLQALLAAAGGAHGGLRQGDSALRAELVSVTRRCLAAELELLPHSERHARAELTDAERLQWAALVQAERSARAAASLPQGGGQKRGAGAVRRVGLRAAPDGEPLTRGQFLRRFGRYREWNRAPPFSPALPKPRMRLQAAERRPVAERRPAAEPTAPPEPKGPPPQLAAPQLAPQLAARPEAGPSRPPQVPAPLGTPTPNADPPLQGPCAEPSNPPPASEPPPAAAADEAEPAQPRRRPCLAATAVACSVEVRCGPDGKPRALGMDVVEKLGRAFVTGLAPGGAAECAGVPRQGQLISIGGLRVDDPGQVVQIGALLERLDRVEVCVHPLLHAPQHQAPPSRPVRGGRIASAGSSRSGSPAGHAPAPGPEAMRAKLLQWVQETPIGNSESCSDRHYDIEPLLAYAVKNKLYKQPPEKIYKQWVDSRAAEGDAAGPAGEGEDGYVIL